MSCDNEGSSSSSASYFEGRGYGHCCPHVVDTEWFFLFLAALGVGTVFLRNQITMNITGRRRRRKRRRRSSGGGGDSYYDFAHPFERGIVQRAFSI